MLRSGFIVVAPWLFCTAAACAADATSPVDYVQRNAPFAPAPTVQPERKTLPAADAVQEKRVEKNTVTKAPAAVGERRAPITITETRAKNVQEKSSTRPETITPPRSDFDHRTAAIATSDTEKPAIVTRYQDSLSAASATNMARFPALDHKTTATLNRFVFRKNGETAGSVNDAPVTPAAGGSTVVK